MHKRLALKTGIRSGAIHTHTHTHTHGHTLAVLDGCRGYQNKRDDCSGYNNTIPILKQRSRPDRQYYIYIYIFIHVYIIYNIWSHLIAQNKHVLLPHYSVHTFFQV
jgi:hypothetical protein